jgi:Mn2+/Fe2+ NRAMP family transporter
VQSSSTYDSHVRDARPPWFVWILTFLSIAAALASAVAVVIGVALVLGDLRG